MIDTEIMSLGSSKSPHNFRPTPSSLQKVHPVPSWAGNRWAVSMLLFWNRRHFAGTP